LTGYARRQLVDFLIEKALDPVMKARSYGRSEADKRVLAEAQETVRFEIDRLRTYPTAEAVVSHFRQGRVSPAGRRIAADLERLRLPTFADLQEEFERKARSLGVDA
jgi:hypothetical protein